MKLKLPALPGLLLLVALALPAHAADPAILGEPDEDLVKQVSDLVLENIQVAQCGSTACEPATAMERLDGLLPKSMIAEVINRGAGSAFAQLCGFDWGERAFLPLMRREEASGCWPQRQMAAIEVTHGFAKNFYDRALASDVGTCTADMKAGVEKYLDELRKFEKRKECPRK
ncbi:MAG: hypothetical protein VYB54_05465 [Pseudomonadota bacterium]|nr:hypothetical protein [Pseudomonadota bacterium]